MCAGFFVLFVAGRDVPASSLAGGSLRERRLVTVRNGAGLATTSAIVLAAQSGRAQGCGSSQRRLPVVPSAESTHDVEGRTIGAGHVVTIDAHSAARLTQKERSVRLSAARPTQEERSERLSAARSTPDERSMRQSAARSTQEEPSVWLSAARPTLEEPSMRLSAARSTQEEPSVRLFVLNNVFFGVILTKKST